MLWFIQHYLWDLGRHPDISQNELDAWHLGYLPVNRLFADAVVDELGGDGAGKVVVFHDYHLYTAAAPRCAPPRPRPSCSSSSTSRGCRATTGACCPASCARRSSAGCWPTTSSPSTPLHYVDNFLQGCVDVLDAEVDRRATIGEVRGIAPSGCAPTRSRSTPTCSTTRSRSERVAREEQKLLQRRRRYLLVRVDRLDLSKNIIRGFKAFDRFLDLHPEFKEMITFLALMQPSREDVEEYVEYRERVMQTVAEINTKHGNTDWMPIDVRIQDNFPATLAAYKHYDVLMVNAIFDGMNLVAKEGAAGQRARRRADPLREHRRLRGARRLLRAGQPVRHRGAGRGASTRR